MSILLFGFVMMYFIMKPEGSIRNKTLYMLVPFFEK